MSEESASVDDLRKRVIELERLERAREKRMRSMEQSFVAVLKQRHEKLEEYRDMYDRLWRRIDEALESRQMESFAESADLTPTTAASISSLMDHAADNLDLVATAAASLSATPLE